MAEYEALLDSGAITETEYKIQDRTAFIDSKTPLVAIKTEIPKDNFDYNIKRLNSKIIKNEPQFVKNLK